MLVFLLSLINCFALAATVSAAQEMVLCSPPVGEKTGLNKWFAESKMTRLILVLFLFTLQRICKTVGRYTNLYL